MLGREERHQRDPRGMRQTIDRRFFLRVQASVICDEADVLALERSELLNFEEVQPGLDAPRPPFSRGVFRLRRNHGRGKYKED